MPPLNHEKLCGGSIGRSNRDNRRDYQVRNRLLLSTRVGDLRMESRYLFVYLLDQVRMDNVRTGGLSVVGKGE